MVNEISVVDNLRLENQLTELTSLVRQLAIGQHQPSVAARVCGICTSVEHPTDMCPTLQENASDYPESVGAIVWKATVSARAEFRAICSSMIQTYLECTSKTNRLSTTNSTISSTTIPVTATTKNASSSNLKFQQTISSSNMQFQQNMNATIQDLKMQIAQLANTVSHLQLAGSSNLPSQEIPNPKENASALTLRSGKELPQPASQQLPRSINVDSKPDTNS
ncbi:hypothetical protein CR513_04641, partial [Mucuna pruriens]